MLPQEYTGKLCFDKISNIELNVAITPIPTIKIESSLCILLLSILQFEHTKLFSVYNLLFLSLTNGFKLFDQNLALTAGEPYHSTEMLALNIYNTFYARAGAQWKGLGQAKAVIFCIVVIAISMLQLNATRKREVQS